MIMQIRTDLAMESRDFSGFKNGVSSFVFQHGSIEEIHVNIDTNEAAEALSKSCGKYITLTHGSLLYSDMNEKKKLSQILAETVESLLPHDGDILVIGLGNRHITADALGSRVLDHLLIKRHMK